MQWLSNKLQQKAYIFPISKHSMQSFVAECIRKWAKKSNGKNKNKLSEKPAPERENQKWNECTGKCKKHYFPTLFAKFVGITETIEFSDKKVVNSFKEKSGIKAKQLHIECEKKTNVNGRAKGTERGRQTICWMQLYVTITWESGKV